MRIFNSPSGDPMLLDTAHGLHALHDALEAFLRSAALDASFVAITTGVPAPYDEFLRGLRVRKGGESTLRFSADRWLELSGLPQELKSFSERLLVCKDGEHHHWYSTPVSLIVEVCDVQAEANGS